MRELVGLVLQAGHGGGGQSVGVLGQRVQHLAVHVAAHKVADQLYLTGVVWGAGGPNGAPKCMIEIGGSGSWELGVG